MKQAERMNSVKAPHGKIALVKYGGAAMEDPATRHRVCAEISDLHTQGIQIVVVHGGGKEISRMMERVGLQPHFIDGLRVTDISTMEITEMVLSGAINSDLSSRISRCGARAIGLTGRDARLIQAKPLRGRNGEEMGRTGEVAGIDPSSILALLSQGIVPVVSPVGENEAGEAMNLNADYAAAALAGALHADTCIFLTDVPGVKRDGEVLPRLTNREIQSLIADGTISGGMIPKVECAMRAVEAGCMRALICDASREHIISTALQLIEGSGTVITA
jgi:acetylglutamate kinase